MKSIKPGIFVLCFMVLAIMGLTGCVKNCDEWYELDDKDCVEIRVRSYGTYFGTITSSGQTDNASLILSEYAGDVQRLNMGGGAYMVLSGEASFNMPLQNYYYQGFTYQMEGSGSFSGSQIIMNYILTYQGQSMAVTFSGSR